MLICNNISMLCLLFLLDTLEGAEVFLPVCIQWDNTNTIFTFWVCSWVFVIGHVLKELRFIWLSGSEICHLKEWVFLAGSLLNLEWDRLSIFWKIRHDFLKSSSCWVVWVRRNLKDHWVPSLAVVVRVIFHQTRFLNAPSNLALNKGHASLIKHVEILGF